MKRHNKSNVLKNFNLQRRCNTHVVSQLCAIAFVGVLSSNSASATGMVAKCKAMLAQGNLDEESKSFCLSIVGEDTMNSPTEVVFVGEGFTQPSNNSINTDGWQSAVIGEPNSTKQPQKTVTVAKPSTPNPLLADVADSDITAALASSEQNQIGFGSFAIMQPQNLANQQALNTNSLESLQTPVALNLSGNVADQQISQLLSQTDANNLLNAVQQNGNGGVALDLGGMISGKPLYLYRDMYGGVNSGADIEVPSLNIPAGTVKLSAR